MQKNSHDFSMENIMQLAQSPAGQQLIAMLQKGDPAALQQAIDRAKAGDYSTAGQTLREMLSSAEAQALMKTLGGK